MCRVGGRLVESARNKAAVAEVVVKAEAELGNIIAAPNLLKNLYLKTYSKRLEQRLMR